VTRFATVTSWSPVAAGGDTVSVVAIEVAVTGKDPALTPSGSRSCAPGRKSSVIGG
jgi:hypothetical protein